MNRRSSLASQRKVCWPALGGDPPLVRGASLCPRFEMGRYNWHNHPRDHADCAGLCLSRQWREAADRARLEGPAPRLHEFQQRGACSQLLFYAGMEMNAIHVQGVSNPSRILIAALGTVAIFVLGTLAIAFIIPHSAINLTQSLLVAYFDMFNWAGIGWLAPVMAVAHAIGVLAGVVTWVAGPSSGLLVVAKAGYLPRFWQKTNEHGMATHILVGASLARKRTVRVVRCVAIGASRLPNPEPTHGDPLSRDVSPDVCCRDLFALQPAQPSAAPYTIPGGDIGMWIVGVSALSARYWLVHSTWPDLGRKSQHLCRHPDRVDIVFCGDPLRHLCAPTAALARR
jgi:hypothetical protein